MRSRRQISRVNYAEDFSASAPAADVADPALARGPDAKTLSVLPANSNGNTSGKDKKRKDTFPLNWQRRISPTERTSNVMNFAGAVMEGDHMMLADGTELRPEDHVYVLGEPLGEPYYIGRIMELVLVDKTKTSVASQYKIRVNWLYRPRDILKKALDSRMLYASMNADLCPLQSLRGKCTVRLKEHIEDLDQYCQTPDSFWFDKLYDRHIMRLYDMIPTERVINVPYKVHAVLIERFKYVVVEMGRAKDLCSTPHNCAKCREWCSPEDSVQCARCDQYYHMLCVDPPMHKRPARGFGWSCAPCSGAQELELNKDRGIDKLDIDADARQAAASATAEGANISGGIRYQELHRAFSEHEKAHPDEPLREVRMWPFRYLGIHSQLEDVLDQDDRIYPRASSRLGPKHQAVVGDWPGRPVKYVEAEKQQRKKHRALKTNGNNSLESDDSPVPGNQDKPWIQPKPKGYISRGDDETVTAMWINHSDADPATLLEKAKPYAIKLKVPENTPNFVDACLKAYWDSGLDMNAALATVSSFTRKSLKEPTFTADEKARFKEAVRKFGNELHEVYKEVRTKKSADIVRYYYLWKKTEEGKEIWDNFEGRKSAKVTQANSANGTSGSIDSLASDNDDSAYDFEKANGKRTFRCRFCETTQGREWRRAPIHSIAAPEDDPVPALCIRCARLWRRYATAWENPEEVLAKVNQKTGAGFRRRMERELVEDALAILAERDRDRERGQSRKKMKVDRLNKEKASAALAKDVTSALAKDANSAPTKDAGRAQAKELASAAVSASQSATTSESSTPVPVEKPQNSTSQDPEKIITLPAAAADSKDPVTGPAAKAKMQVAAIDDSENGLSRFCSVCGMTEPSGTLLHCQACRMTCHSQCYGSPDKAKVHGSAVGWLCDCCSNDQKPYAKTLYQCVLCPVRLNTHELSQTHNTKMLPDALKRTIDHNWVHIWCAVFHSSLRFGSPQYLQPTENIAQLSDQAKEATCVVCGTTYGACVECSVCQSWVHAGCAANNGYALGFELTPVQASRRDHTKTIRFNGEDHLLMTAVVMCSHHEQVVRLHSMSEIDDETGQTALQIYCQNYKQSDTTVTGMKKRALSYPLDKIMPDQHITQLPKMPHQNLVVDVATGQAENTSDKLCCSTCSRPDALMWFSQGPDKVACPSCHWKSVPADEIRVVDADGSQQLLAKTQEALKAVSRAASARAQAPTLTNILNPA